MVLDKLRRVSPDAIESVAFSDKNRQEFLMSTQPSENSRQFAGTLNFYAKPSYRQRRNGWEFVGRTA